MKASPKKQRIVKLLEVGSINTSEETLAEERWEKIEVVKVAALSSTHKMAQQRKRRVEEKGNIMKNANKNYFARVDDGGAPDEFKHDWFSSVKSSSSLLSSRKETNELQRNSTTRMRTQSLKPVRKVKKQFEEPLKPVVVAQAEVRPLRDANRRTDPLLDLE